MGEGGADSRHTDGITVQGQGKRGRGREGPPRIRKVMTRVHVGMLRYINLNPNSNLVLSFSRLR